MYTIAGISTPLGVGGISVIRLSGKDSLTIADKIFKGQKTLGNMPGYTAVKGVIIGSQNEVVDDVVALVFRSPRSYTGEDVVEFSCHGGQIVTESILRLLFQNGAQPAGAGEFSKRAFLNGKLDLIKAEAVIDLISSESLQGAKAAANNLNGAVTSKVSFIKEKIAQVTGHLAAWADFPEEDIEEITPESLLQALRDIEKDISGLIQSYDTGKIIKSGINTAIAGKPNVGKSTLMNLLSGQQKSIVSATAGTTRDVVEQSVSVSGITLHLADTAGIHATEDEIESMGVKLSLERLQAAQLILCVFDNSLPLNEEDYNILQKADADKTIAIINKTDLENKAETQIIEQHFKHIIFISDKDKDGYEKLYNKIEAVLKISPVTPNMAVIANERQFACLNKAQINIKQAIQSLLSGITLDGVTVLCEQALDELLSLTGEKATEEVVNQVFSRFCVGK